MKVHVLQHVPFEGLGSIESWLTRRNAQISYTRFYTQDSLPPVHEVDLVIAMGGPMSVNDEADLPWLKTEKQFLREAMNRDIPVLGICLGAQLIASALGARVYLNSTKEIGWFPISGISAPGALFHFPPTCTVFHWHGETFDLPEGAIRLATSTACENQAFQWNRNVIGLQFHLETTRNSALALVEHCGDELVRGPFVQTEEDLRAMPPSQYESVNRLMCELLTSLINVPRIGS